jgi:hypothetical protein
VTNRTPADYDLDARATLALDEAGKLQPGPEKTEALKKAGLLRNAADIQGLFIAKRGRPAK